MVLIALVVLFAYFSFNKDDIARRLLNYTNTITAGELSFQDISLSPFIHFPQISISLNKVSYFDSKVEERDATRQAIITLEKLYLAFNLPDLIMDKFHVTGLIVEIEYFFVKQ